MKDINVLRLAVESAWKWKQQCDAAVVVANHDDYPAASAAADEAHDAWAAADWELSDCLVAEARRGEDDSE